MPLSYWALLGFTVWTLLLLIGGIGTTRVSAILQKRARPSSFNASEPHGSPAYQRRMRAHMNCVENLPIFASLVLLGGALGLTEPSFQYAAFTVLPARLGQSVVHMASGRDGAINVRFAFFSVQIVCFTVMAGLLAWHGWGL